MPPNIDKTNKMTLSFSKNKLAMAGPGHNPFNPHPIPKNTDPIISLLSMSLVLGILNFPLNSGFFRFKMRLNDTKLNNTAPNKTNTKVGSHDPKTSKNPTTLFGSIIEDTDRPTEKRRPAKKLAINCLKKNSPLKKQL